MKNETHIIYQDTYFMDEADYAEAYAECLSVNGLDADDYTIDDFMADEAEQDFEFEKMNLSKRIPEGIAVLATIQTWRGIRECMLPPLTNLNECLRSYCRGNSYIRLYVECGDLCMDEVHHDGTNFYRFRKWRSDASDEDMEKAIDNDDLALAEKLTESLLLDLYDIYGWGA